MWWAIAIGVLVVGVIVYAEWRERRGPGRSHTTPLDTRSSRDGGEQRPLDGYGGALDG